MYGDNENPNAIRKASKIKTKLDAAAAGLTSEVALLIGADTLHVMVDPACDYEGIFMAFDCDARCMIQVYGWTVEEICSWADLQSGEW